MRPDNSHYLLAAQRFKHAELIDRAQTAIRSLDRQGEVVSFAAVVRASGVSRSFLNKVPELAAEVRRLRHAQAGRPHQRSSGQRMSDGSKDARIRQLLETNRKLREEAARLTEQNAVLLGKLRFTSTPMPG